MFSMAGPSLRPVEKLGHGIDEMLSRDWAFLAPAHGPVDVIARLAVSLAKRVISR